MQWKDDTTLPPSQQILKKDLAAWSGLGAGKVHQARAGQVRRTPGEEGREDERRSMF